MIARLETRVDTRVCPDPRQSSGDHPRAARRPSCPSPSLNRISERWRDGPNTLRRRIPRRPTSTSGWRRPTRRRSRGPLRPGGIRGRPGNSTHGALGASPTPSGKNPLEHPVAALGRSGQASCPDGHRADPAFRPGDGRETPRTPGRSRPAHLVHGRLSPGSAKEHSTDLSPVLTYDDDAGTVSSAVCAKPTFQRLRPRACDDPASLCIDPNNTIRFADVIIIQEVAFGLPMLLLASVGGLLAAVFDLRRARVTTRPIHPQCA